MEGCLGLAGGADSDVAGVACLSEHRSTGELEDELPVRRLTALVGLLHGVGQLAGVQLGVPTGASLGWCGHGPNATATVIRA